MPIHLPVPGAPVRGPDGQGWNRIALGSLAGDECALRPRRPTKLIESFDTRLAAYGGFGPCVRDGRCTGCPVLARITHPALRPVLSTGAARVLFRPAPARAGIWLADGEQAGAPSHAGWTLEQLAALEAWEFERLHRDEHGEGFWLHRIS
ncbi:hypothetical protein [Streptomyces sp. NPDC001889]